MSPLGLIHTVGKELRLFLSHSSVLSQVFGCQAFISGAKSAEFSEGMVLLQAQAGNKVIDLIYLREKAKGTPAEPAGAGNQRGKFLLSCSSSTQCVPSLLAAHTSASSLTTDVCRLLFLRI